MLQHSLPYRLSAALLALTVLLTGAAPLAAHLCGMDMHGAEPACCAMYDSSEQSAHDPCPMQPPDETPMGDADAPATAACCTDAPPSATERVAVAPPAAPELWAEVAPLASWLVPSAAPVEHPRPLDTGPPVPTLRPHLAFSVLLI